MHHCESAAGIENGRKRRIRWRNRLGQLVEQVKKRRKEIERRKELLRLDPFIGKTSRECLLHESL